MRRMAGLSLLWSAVLLGTASAQSASNLAALRGLAPLAALGNTQEGRTALAANLAVTAAIQTGTAKQPLPRPFVDEEGQALRDAFITGANAAELADGLGTRLGAAYRARADYTAPKSYTSLAPEVATLLGYTLESVGGDSQAAKYFFANATSNGEKRLDAEAAAILPGEHGQTDTFGRAYHLQAGAPGADPYGDSRPFQTEPQVRHYDDPDYFGRPATNTAYLTGPVQDLVASPSFPSGHTAYGTAAALLLGDLVPERFPQEVARAAEYGNDRIVVGAHYAMDVIGGRTLAYYDVAHLLANDPAYVGQTRRHAATVSDIPAALAAARAAARPLLEQGCGARIAACAADDHGRFNDAPANAALVSATLTYGLPVVHAATAGHREDVARIAPEAGHLLTAPFPWLTLAQADRILTETEGPGGGFLDDGSGFGVYSRLDLFAASAQALAEKPKP